MVRKKNVLATVMQSFAVTCLVTVLWMVIGYSLAFTTAAAAAIIGGFELHVPGADGDRTRSTISPRRFPKSVFMTFQMTFAIITPALICGAFADRMKFSAHAVVHGSVAARRLRADRALGVGRRLPRRRGRARLSPAARSCTSTPASRGWSPRSSSASASATAPRTWRRTTSCSSLIGASLLWVGWFGFNAGSAVAAGANAGMAMAVTQIAAAAAALAWMFVEWIVAKKPSVLGIISGAVAGLVAITPASGFVDPMGALIIGIVAGVVCYSAPTSLKRALRL